MADEMFGPYRIGPLIGRGGMGEVHRAHDTAHDRVVALKRLAPGVHDDAAFRARFRREAQIVARLREPHVIPIHAYGEIDGRLYLDMRLVDGEDLTDVIARGPLAPERAVRIVEQVAGALDAAHADGLVHRDVKPSNILVAPGDFVYLVDFGIARTTSTAGTQITASGDVIGTVDYMAPERFENVAVDARSDIYALACVLFACLTGRRPFDVDGTAAQIWAHMQDPPPKARPVNPAVPPALDNVIARGMAKDPAARHESAGALATAARAALAVTPPPPPAAIMLTTPLPTTPVHGTAPRPPVPPAPDGPVLVSSEPADLERGRRVVLAVVAVLLVALVVAFVISNAAAKSLFNGSGSTPDTSTTETTTTTTQTTTTTPGPKPEEQALLAALPEAYRTTACTPEPADADGVTAKVVCAKAAGWSPRFPPPVRAEFRLFATRAAQDAHFKGLVTGRGIPRDDSQGGCRPTTRAVHYSTYYRDTSGPLDGDFTTCYLDGGTGTLWWTDSRTVTTGSLFTAPGADDNDLENLDTWWNTTILSEM